MIRQLPLFIFILLSFAIFSQSKSFIDPAYFLKESATASEYNAAYLVTNGDTLMTWNKTGNRTIATYLNTKVTKTVWADSVELCTQEGFLLNAFQEYCQRMSTRGKLISRTWKSVDEFRYSKMTGNDEVFYVKSYSHGLKAKGRKMANGEIQLDENTEGFEDVENLDSLFQISRLGESNSKAVKEILVVLKSKDSFTTISNSSVSEMFMHINEQPSRKDLKLKTYLYYVTKAAIIQKRLKKTVLKTTYDLDLH